jgi:hypothetical protein
MTDHLLIPRELVSRIRQHLAELRELNADLTWTDVSEVAELDALKPAQFLDLERVAKYRPEIDPLDGLSMTMDNVHGEWLEVYDICDKLLPPTVGYSSPTMKELEEIIMGKAVTDAAGRAAVEEIYSLIRKRDIQEAIEPLRKALTPAAQLRDPAVLVEALERIEMICYENIGVEKEIETVASEALAEWKGGLNE